MKPVLTLNKAICIGFTVLELSKSLMYDFHYNFIEKILVVIHCLLIQTVLLMKSSQKIFMKNFLNINPCLTLVNINQIFLIQLTKKLVAKSKMNLEEFKSINLLDQNKKCIVSDDDT